MPPQLPQPSGYPYVYATFRCARLVHITKAWKTKAANQDLRPLDLTGISDKTLEMHFQALRGASQHQSPHRENRRHSCRWKGRQGRAATTPSHRRLGYKYADGPCEHYFGNMSAAGVGTTKNAGFRSAVEQASAFDIWKTDFVSVGKMRGVNGPSPISIPRTAASRITGSSCTRTATLPASSRCW